MQIASVVGQAVSTVKHPSLHGWRLLVVQPLGVGGKADGEPLIAIDHLGAGAGERVIVTNDGASAREAVKDRKSPVRWMVIGLVDAQGA
jgi:ethanolamine utilization protein EutN